MPTPSPTAAPMTASSSPAAISSAATDEKNRSPYELIHAEDMKFAENMGSNQKFQMQRLPSGHILCFTEVGVHNNTLELVMRPRPQELGRQWKFRLLDSDTKQFSEEFTIPSTLIGVDQFNLLGFSLVGSKNAIFMGFVNQHKNLLIQFDLKTKKFTVVPNLVNNTAKFLFNHACFVGDEHLVFCDMYYEKNSEKNSLTVHNVTTGVQYVLPNKCVAVAANHEGQIAAVLKIGAIGLYTIKDNRLIQNKLVQNKLIADEKAIHHYRIPQDVKLFYLPNGALLNVMTESWQKNITAIQIIDLATGTAKELTFDFTTSNATLSADGKTLVAKYESNRGDLSDDEDDQKAVARHQAPNAGENALVFIDLTNGTFSFQLQDKRITKFVMMDTGQLLTKSYHTDKTELLTLQYLDQFIKQLNCFADTHFGKDPIPTVLTQMTREFVGLFEESRLQAAKTNPASTFKLLPDQLTITVMVEPTSTRIFNFFSSAQTAISSVIPAAAAAAATATALVSVKKGGKSH